MVQPLSPLAVLDQALAEPMAAVNRLILEQMQSDVPQIPEIAAWLVAAGGKRIRPLLTLASAEICGAAGPKAALLAACVEFIHTATLLHDDVVDESATRRGRASANRVYGNKSAVLVGDFLFSRAFQSMVAAESLRILKTLADAAAIIAEGEVLQLMATSDLTTDLSRYSQIIRGKTAALFAAATEVGALLGHRPEAEVTAMRTYGEALGMAFQIADDALDYAADPEALGKSVGDDLREGKVTLPVIHAYAMGDAAERRFWEQALHPDSDPDEAALAEAQRLLQRHDAIAVALGHARDHAARAAAALEAVPEHPLRTVLADLASFVVTRDR